MLDLILIFGFYIYYTACLIITFIAIKIEGAQIKWKDALFVLILSPFVVPIALFKFDSYKNIEALVDGACNFVSWWKGIWHSLIVFLLVQYFSFCIAFTYGVEDYLEMFTIMLGGNIVCYSFYIGCLLGEKRESIATYKRSYGGPPETQAVTSGELLKENIKLRARCKHLISELEFRGCVVPDNLILENL